MKERLYQGNAKAAEGYAARLTFAEAKKQGMRVEINWQDADSSSSNVEFSRCHNNDPWWAVRSQLKNLAPNMQN